MKKITINFFLIFFPIVSICQSFYSSVGFEKAGLTEYLCIDPNGNSIEEMISYWTSENKNSITLSTIGLDNNSYQVKFPNSTATYILTLTGSGLTCKHPNGYLQIFNLLPTIYFSENFEKQGVTEYLTEGNLNGGEWIYFTNQNPGTARLQYDILLLYSKVVERC